MVKLLDGKDADRVMRVESESDANMAMKYFESARDRFLALSEFPKPLQGSMLAIEDKSTALVMISSQIEGGMNRAQDALEALFSLVYLDPDQPGFRPFAQYALIRMAVESAAVGIWLMRPNRKAPRVSRSLSLAMRHAEDEWALVSALTGDKSETAKLRQYRARLHELKDTVSQLREQQIKPMPSWSTVVGDASKSLKVGLETKSPLTVWRVASAFLHGSENTIRMFSELEQVGDWNNGVARVEVRPMNSVIAASTMTAVQMLEHLVERATQLGGHDYQGKSV